MAKHCQCVWFASLYTIDRYVREKHGEDKQSIPYRTSWQRSRMLADGDEALTLSKKSRAKVAQAQASFKLDIERLDSLAMKISIHRPPPEVPENYHRTQYEVVEESLWKVVEQDEPHSALWTDVLKIGHAVPIMNFIPEEGFLNEVEGYTNTYAGSESTWKEFMDFTKMNHVVQYVHDHGRWPELQCAPG